MRFSDRILGDQKSFAKNAKIVQVDIDPVELGKNLRVDIPILGNISTILGEFLIQIKKLPDFGPWINELKSVK